MDVDRYIPATVVESVLERTREKIAQLGTIEDLLEDLLGAAVEVGNGRPKALPPTRAEMECILREQEKSVGIKRGGNATAATLGRVPEWDALTVYQRGVLRAIAEHGPILENDVHGRSRPHLVDHGLVVFRGGHAYLTETAAAILARVDRDRLVVELDEDDDE